MAILCSTIPHLAVARAVRDGIAAPDQPLLLVDARGRVPRVHAADRLAHRAGVRAGHTLRQAQLRCPTTQIVAADDAADAAVQTTLMEVLAQSTPHVVAGATHPHGTVYADLERTTARTLLTDLPELAAAIWQATGLAPALGVAPGWWVAARAAQIARTHGILVVPPRSVVAFLAPQSSAVAPVDRRVVQRLTILGLSTLGAVARVPMTALQQQLGAAAHILHRCAQGDDPWPLAWPAPVEPLTVTCACDAGIADQRVLTAACQTLAGDLAPHLQQQARSAQQITLHMLCDDDVLHTVTRTLATPTQQVAVLAAQLTGMCDTLPIASAVEQITVIVEQAVACAVGQATMFPVPSASATMQQEVVQRLHTRFAGALRTVQVYDEHAHLPEAHAAVVPWERR